MRSFETKVPRAMQVGTRAWSLHLSVSVYAEDPLCKFDCSYVQDVCQSILCYMTKYTRVILVFKICLPDLLNNNGMASSRGLSKVIPIGGIGGPLILQGKSISVHASNVAMESKFPV